MTKGERDLLVAIGEMLWAWARPVGGRATEQIGNVRNELGRALIAVAEEPAGECRAPCDFVRPLKPASTPGVFVDEGRPRRKVEEQSAGPLYIEMFAPATPADLDAEVRRSTRLIQQAIMRDAEAEAQVALAAEERVAPTGEVELALEPNEDLRRLQEAAAVGAGKEGE